MTDESVLWRFGASLCVGLLMGLVRERSPHSQAGVRTYALVAALGTGMALLEQQGVGGWMLPAGVLALAGMMVQATRSGAAHGDAGTTSTVAVLLCFCLGAAIWTGPLIPAVVVGLVATGLLHFKPELESFATRLSAADVTGILRFAVLTVLILPLLPDRAMGPYDALNPYRLWWMVVLISGIGLGGYLFLKLLGPERGSVVAGVLGGLVSSTATTMAFSRRVRADPLQLEAARAVIVLATLVVLARVAVFTALFSPTALRPLAPMLTCAVAAGLVPVLSIVRGVRERHTLDVNNPGELGPALGLVILFAVVQLGAAWLQHHLGDSGLYVASLVSGAVDLDAIVLSVLQGHAQGHIEGTILMRCVALAYSASLLAKLLLAVVLGGRSLGRALVTPFAVIALGMLTGAAIG